MKKIILTVAIAAASSGAVNAATIYEADGLKYDLKGDFQLQLRQKVGKDKDLDLEFDDIELKNRVTYDLGSDMTAFGQLDFSYDDSANDKYDGRSDLEEAYLGLSFGDIDVSFGKRDLSSDEFGVEASYEEAGDAFDELIEDGDDVIRLDANFGNVYVSASTELEAQGNSAADNDSAFDVFVAADLGVAQVGLSYLTYEAEGSNDSQEAYGVMASFDAGFAELAADYSTAELSTATDVDVYNLVATFKVAETTKASVGYNNVDEDGTDEVATWYANVTYKFPTQKNVSVFAELADSDEDDSELGYLAGMRVKF
ncbi:porin [Amphritea japonica]|uniref:Porin n=1 Tax=Amphritea japonica ATCC BAA-1530 TaxID=1278309 RepID=A0A7R6PA87_9GAMM|nr:porin [Amphritea japonica]BBB25431.1 porin [Amphritea japonica ATCC BAA-1530]